MVVGTLSLTLYIGGMKSLKGQKKCCEKSLLSKIRSKLNVSAAETGENRIEWNKCELGFAV